MSMYVEWVVGAVLACAVTVLAGYVLIPILRSHKIGQIIYELGPAWHKNKQHTPTMGGICFILGVMIVMAGFFVREAIMRTSTVSWVPMASALCLAIGNGAIGFIDDYTKLVKKQNQGLNETQKLTLQLIVATIYVFIMAKCGYLYPTFVIPFLDIQVNLGFLFYPIAVIVIAGVVNSVNLTDGIDGLASSIASVLGIFFVVVAVVYDGRQLGLCGAILLGGMVGFLIYNHHPACVFMGDTGSLFLGGLIIGVGFMINQPLAMVLASLVYVFEMLSSLLQRVYFKISHGKRIFKMAPFHHHCEKCGWGETKIVRVFTATTVFFCLAAYFGLNGMFIL